MTTNDTKVEFAQNVADNIVAHMFTGNTTATVEGHTADGEFGTMFALTVEVARDGKSTRSPIYPNVSIACVEAYLRGMACDADGVSQCEGHMIATDGSMKTLASFNTTDECMAFSDGHAHRGNIYP